MEQIAWGEVQYHREPIKTPEVCTGLGLREWEAESGQLCVCVFDLNTLCVGMKDRATEVAGVGSETAGSKRAGLYLV